MISLSTKGDFKKLNSFLEQTLEKIELGSLNKYGNEGVEALKNATPKNTGKTADSWYYEIIRSNGSISISFNNTNINNGVPIAIILQYGHATNNGGYVQGIDYINPALSSVFDKIAEKAWNEIKTYK